MTGDSKQRQVIYVIDKRDVCCPNCYEEITVSEIDNAQQLPRFGNLERSEMTCSSCQTIIELREPRV